MSDRLCLLYRKRNDDKTDILRYKKCKSKADTNKNSDRKSYPKMTLHFLQEQNSIAEYIFLRLLSDTDFLYN